MVTESLQKAFKWPVGYLLHENFQVKCAGTAGIDANGMPIVSDRHLICTLGNHLPGAQAHAIGNSEFVDSMWIVDSSQSAIDWTNPTCCICGKGIAP